MELIVIKKNGAKDSWKTEKIVNAMKLANGRAKVELTEGDYNRFTRLVETEIKSAHEGKEVVEVSVDEIHEAVQHVLKEKCLKLYQEYAQYRNFKQRYSKAYEKAKEKAVQIVWNGDTENANKDSFLNATKSFLIGNAFMGEMMKEFVMEKEWIDQHEEGYIHIHDLSERFINSKNCNLFNLSGVLEDGFELNGIRYEEPNTVRTAFSVAGDIILSASSQQYGGFTISEIDKVMSKYAKKTYENYLKKFMDVYKLNYTTAENMALNFTLEEIRKGYKGFEVKISTIGGGLGQTPFTTISFGLQTDYWSRKVAEAILKQRIEGIGANKQTPIFPKLVFLHSKDTVGEGKINNDLFELGIQCSRTRLYPDFLSVDSDNSIGVSYKASGEPVSPMGCRAYLGYWEKDGKAIVNGRANCGAVTINLPLLGIEAKGDKEKFFGLIDKYAKTVFDIHEWTYKRLEKAKGSSNPLYYCEGGAFMKVGYDESIKPIVEGMTASLGYIGLEETCQAMFNKPLSECEEFAVEVMDYLWSKVEEYKKRDGRLYTLYATPAESLIGRFQMINRQKHGVIKDVTSRDYMTNSFHQGVWRKHNPIQKINYESPLFDRSHGGRIIYTEYPYNVEHNVLKQVVEYGMEKGLYQGINIESCNCNECGHQGEFEVCPKCGSDNVNIVDRCCGYLSFKKVKGNTRYNESKLAEIRERVIHLEGYSRGNEEE